MRRRPALYLLTTILALATAVALAGAAFTMDSPAAGRTVPRAAEGVVARFYAAANTAIATGDVAALEAVVAADYVEREPLPGLSPDRDGLVRHLRALHEVVPDVRLEVTALVADGDEVMARVAVLADEQPRFLGLPIHGQLAVWGPVDRFRIAGDRIVARWAAPGGISVLEPLQRGAVEAVKPVLQVMTLERYTFAGWGEAVVPAGWGTRLVAVETGQLAVRVDLDAHAPAVLRQQVAGASAATTEVAPGTSAVARAGDLLALPEEAAATLRRESGERAAALVVTMDEPLVGPGSWNDALPSSDGDDTLSASGVARDVLAGEMSTVLAGGATAVAFGRVTLAPGATLAVTQAPGPQLLTIEDGSAALASATGGIRLRSGTNDVTRAMDEPTWALPAGDGVFVPAGAETTLTNLGPAHATVLVVALTPDATGPPLARIEATWPAGYSGNPR